MAFVYEYALVCETIPQSIVNGLSLGDREPVDLVKASSQHNIYLNTLRECGLELISIASNEAFPDCVFVEDTCVAIRNRVFVTNPGAETRRGEIEAVRDKLDSVKNKLGLVIGHVSNRREAFLDGGDVLFTGRELLVGLSSRTNQKGSCSIK
jgi:dimethylargininase